MCEDLWEVYLVQREDTSNAKVLWQEQVEDSEGDLYEMRTQA